MKINFKIIARINLSLIIATALMMALSSQDRIKIASADGEDPSCRQTISTLQPCQHFSGNGHYVSTWVSPPYYACTSGLQNGLYPTCCQYSSHTEICIYSDNTDYDNGFESYILYGPNAASCRNGRCQSGRLVSSDETVNMDEHHTVALGAHLTSPGD